jgi:glycosyltransferase involved in cell wall biosynthesis
MSAQPKLAMLIPAYNAARYLPRLLDSARQQTRPFDEIWVYDDCSTDETAAVAERYRARVVRGGVNRGCSHGKNRLAAETTCDWIHFHDADDELMPNFVERAHVWMADGRSDVVLFAYEERDDRTGKVMGYRRFDVAAVSADARAYTLRNQVNPFCGLYRRDAFLEAGAYDEDPLVLYNEDVAMHIRLAFRGLSFAADEAVTVINHRRFDSMSAANGLKCIQAHYHVLRKAAELEGSQPYASDISWKLWIAVGVLTAYLDWQTADAAATLAVRLAGRSSVPTSRLFKALCYASPNLAIRAREWSIRALKPALRRGYPGWRRSNNNAD